jgi:hypothetical protein
MEYELRRNRGEFLLWKGGINVPLGKPSQPQRLPFHFLLEGKWVEGLG